MEINDVKEKLKEKLGDEYFSLSYKETFHFGKMISKECFLYVNGLNFIVGKNWREAFSKLSKELRAKK